MMYRVLSKLFWGELKFVMVQLYGTLALAVAVILTRTLLRERPNTQVLTGLPLFADLPALQLLSTGLCVLATATLNLLAIHGRKLSVLLFRPELLGSPSTEEFNTDFKPDDISALQRAL
jgi:hypothetical protein